MSNPMNFHQQLFEVLTRLKAGSVDETQATVLIERFARDYYMPLTPFPEANVAHQPGDPAAHLKAMEALARGEPGRYEFRSLMGESYLDQERRMHEAAHLALKFKGTFQVIRGTDTQPEYFAVQIPNG